MTPEVVARRAVEFIAGAGESWLELGSGTGSLAAACLEKADPESFIGVEIDQRLLQLGPQDPRATFLRADVLRPQALAEVLGGGLFGRTVGNPPYGLRGLPLACQRRLAELCPGIPQVMNWVQVDLYFVLESLARLRRPSEAAFIVAAPLAADAGVTAFRRTLVTTASEVECFELPGDTFGRKAEVQSYLLVARFGSSKPKLVRVGRLVGAALDVVDERWISLEQAADRLDVGHYEFQELNRRLLKASGGSKLSSCGASVVRGSRTRAQFESMSVECFHTTDFPSDGREVTFGRSRDFGFRLAEAGDVLLPRVGTRCLQREAIVTRGRRPYTEAVLRLRLPHGQARRACDWMSSEDGTAWRRAAARGSCAKHLTVASILEMPTPWIA